MSNLRVENYWQNEVTIEPTLAPTISPNDESHDDNNISDTALVELILGNLFMVGSCCYCLFLYYENRHDHDYNYHYLG